MNLYLVRHTKVNCADGLCYGQTDVDVLPSFNKEIKPILQKLQSIPFHKTFSSPLKRCSRLATKISQNNKDIVYDKRLMEMNFGLWEEKKWTEISNTPEAKLWFEDFVNTPCPNGESYKDLINRVSEFLSDIRTTDNTDANILIVTHSGIIRAMHSLIHNTDPQKSFDFKVEFGEITKIKLI